MSGTIEYPPRGEARYCVVVMTLAMAFAFFDRQIPTMLIGPIQADLGLSDTQIALLGGVAFSVFYAVMALPIGYAVDRVSRAKVVGTGVMTWSVMTALAGFADSFLKLFGARVGVAIGEAVIAPTSVSLVGDYYPPNKQGRPLGIISAGVYIGMGMALIGGGFIIEYLTELGGLTIPGIGYFKPWQGTFLIVGVPGILVAIAAYMIVEPKRQQVRAERVPALDIITHIKAHSRAIVLMFTGIIFIGMMSYSFIWWAPIMLVRTYDMSISEVGYTLGVITIISSTIGTIATGTVIDLVRKRGYLDAPLRVGACIAAIATPFGIAAPLMPDPVLSLALIFVLMMLISGLTPLGMTAVGNIATSTTRGQLTGVYALVLMVFSMSLGPQLTAFFTDFVFMDQLRLNWSVSLTAAIVLTLGAIFLTVSLRPYSRSIETLNSGESPSSIGERGLASNL